MTKLMHLASRRMLFSLGLALVLAGSASPAFAFNGVPEIDPGSASSALALLAGGMLVLTSRLSRK
jgi:hypothetical protein